MKKALTLGALVTAMSLSVACNKKDPNFVSDQTLRGDVAKFEHAVQIDPAQISDCDVLFARLSAGSRIDYSGEAQKVLDRREKYGPSRLAPGSFMTDFYWRDRRAFQTQEAQFGENYVDFLLDTTERLLEKPQGERVGLIAAARNVARNYDDAAGNFTENLRDAAHRQAILARGSTKRSGFLELARLIDPDGAAEGETLIGNRAYNLIEEEMGDRYRDLQTLRTLGGTFLGGERATVVETELARTYFNRALTLVNGLNASSTNLNMIGGYISNSAQLMPRGQQEFAGLIDDILLALEAKARDIQSDGLDLARDIASTGRNVKYDLVWTEYKADPALVERLGDFGLGRIGRPLEEINVRFVQETDFWSARVWKSLDNPDIGLVVQDDNHYLELRPRFVGREYGNPLFRATNSETGTAATGNHSLRILITAKQAQSYLETGSVAGVDLARGRRSGDSIEVSASLHGLTASEFPELTYDDQRMHRRAFTPNGVELEASNAVVPAPQAEVVSRGGRYELRLDFGKKADNGLAYVAHNKATNQWHHGAAWEGGLSLPITKAQRDAYALTGAIPDVSFALADASCYRINEGVPLTVRASSSGVSR